MEHQDRTSRMLALVKQWLQTDQSQKTFALQQEIKPATFAYWVKKHKQRHRPVNGFDRIELSDAHLVQRPAKIEIELADGVVVRIF